MKKSTKNKLIRTFGSYFTVIMTYVTVSFFQQFRNTRGQIEVGAISINWTIIVVTVVFFYIAVFMLTQLISLDSKIYRSAYPQNGKKNEKSD